MKAAFIGMGKLGFPCALAAAVKHDVVGYDVSAEPKRILAECKYPHMEKHAQEYLEKTTLRMVDSVADAVAHAEIVFIAVQTPHQPAYEGTVRMPKERAEFDYTWLCEAVASVAKEAAAQKKHIALVVVSTVLPGTSEVRIKPLLNEYTADYAYNPFFIAMSTTIDDYLKPEFVLIGVDHWGKGVAVGEFYRQLHGVLSPIRTMSVASAELTKVAYNVAVGFKIVQANAIMEIAEKLRAKGIEVDCDDVSDTLAQATDRIVSAKYTYGGMGDGGNCFVEGQLIHVEDGVRAIDEIEKGERVLAGDGRFHEVLDTYKRPFKGKVYTIKGRGLSPFTVTGEHPIHVAKACKGPQRGAIKEVRAKDLTENFYIAFPIPIDATLRKLWRPPGPHPSDIYERDGVWYHKVNSIEVSEYEGTVYNLNVADLHNYVCVGGLVSNCHPRDQIALSFLARKLELSYDLFEALVRAREEQTAWLAQLCWDHAHRRALPIVIFGKAYKRGTNLTGGSPAFLLYNILQGMDATAYYPAHFPVTIWDPLVDAPREFLEPAVFIIATDHSEFAAFQFPLGSVVIDPWGFIADRDSATVIRIGRP